MGLRINTNVAAINASRTLNRTTRDLNVNLERLSSGLRINRAKDDAAGLAISEGFRVVIRGSIVAQRNVQDGISFLQTAEGALQETTNMLQRIRELAVQAANGTNNLDNQTALQREVNQLLDQIDDIANDTEFNDLRPLDGTDPVIKLQSGLRKGMTLDIQSNGALRGDLDTGFTAAGEVPAGWNEATETVQDGLFTGNNGLENLGIVGTKNIAGEDRANAELALPYIDEAIEYVSGLRSQFGAQHNRLEFTLQTLAIQEENSSASDSALRDADIARETISFTRNQILLSSGTSVLAQANVVPQTALQLLGG